MDESTERILREWLYHHQNYKPDYEKFDIEINGNIFKGCWINTAFNGSGNSISLRFECWYDVKKLRKEKLKRIL